MEAPPIIASRERRPAWRLAAAAGLALALGMVLFEFNPSQHGFYPRCLLYTTTGIYCPGCGSLRAMHQLTHGHLAAALRCNPLLVLSLPFAVYFAARWGRLWVSGEPLPPLVMHPRWIVIFAIVLAVFSVARNIRVAPFIYLAPP